MAGFNVGYWDNIYCVVAIIFDKKTKLMMVMKMTDLRIIGSIVVICCVVVIGFFLVQDIVTDDVHHYYKITDKRIERGYGSDFILVTTNGEYTVPTNDYCGADINDTFDIITSNDGRYKGYRIVKR